LDTCEIIGSVILFDKEWKGLLYFLDEKLCRIELEETGPSLTTSYFDLCTLFGKPNLQRLKVINSKFESVSPVIVGISKRDFEPYTENLNDILKKFSNPNKDSGFHLISYEQYLLNQNEDQLAEPDIYHGRPKRVKIKYYPQLDFEGIWKSKCILQLLISRIGDLEIGGNSILSNSENKLSSGYRILIKHKVKFNFYDCKETMEYFRNLKKKSYKELEDEKVIKRDERDILQKF
jgi:hypothetical protein